MKDLRKEQIALLKLEKKIAGLAIALVGCAGVAKAADGKLHANQGTEAYASMEAALMNLAEVTGKAHEALNVKAVEAGAKLLEAAGGGLPKDPPAKVVASILGLG